MASIERRETADGRVRWTCRVFIGRDPSRVERNNRPLYEKERSRAGTDGEAEPRYLVASGSGGKAEEWSRHHDLTEAEGEAARLMKENGRSVVTLWLADGFPNPATALLARLRRKLGKRRFVVKTFDTQREAKKEARRLERMKDKGGLTEPSKERLSEYLERWLETKEGEVRARTIHDYRGILRRYIQEPPDGAPRIGSVQLNRLSAETFEELYTFLWKEKELSPRTIQYLHTIVRQALGDAVKRRALPSNPTDHAKRPTRPWDAGDDAGQSSEKAIRAMSEAEAGRFIEAAREDRYFALWCVLLMGGLRPGEALGLKWPDVNLEGGKIHVQRALSRTGVPKVCECGHLRDVHDREGHGECTDPDCDGCDGFEAAPGTGWKLVPPKSRKGSRVVLLPAVATRALQEWRAEQARERLKLGAEYADFGFVFTTEWGQPLDGANLNSRNFRTIMATAGLGAWEVIEGGKWTPASEAEDPDGAFRRRFQPAFRMYDLRHTCATLLLKRGVNPKIVQERLGHANITLTLDTYSHVLPDMQGGAAEELEAVFGSGS